MTFAMRDLISWEINVGMRCSEVRFFSFYVVVFEEKWMVYIFQILQISYLIHTTPKIGFADDDFVEQHAYPVIINLISISMDPCEA